MQQHIHIQPDQSDQELFQRLNHNLPQPSSRSAVPVTAFDMEIIRSSLPSASDRPNESLDDSTAIGNYANIIAAYANTELHRHQRKRLRPKLSSCLPNISTAMFLLVLLAAASNADAEGGQSPFRIVIDAGSTGSRLHIFELGLECQRRGSSKAWTPLSAFAPPSPDSESSSSSSSDVSNIHPNEQLNATHVAHHMLPLFDYASIIIPTEYHSSTPIRIAATAGMRLVSSEAQTLVYNALYRGLVEQIPNERFTFTDLKRENVMTLDGEREGYFGAVAANYLRGVVDAELKVIVQPEDHDDEAEHTDVAGLEGIDDQGLCTNKFGMCEQDAENVIFGPSHHYISNMHDVKRHGPLGALDMGGSSTQIVYRRTGGGQSGYGSLDVNGSLDTEEGYNSSHLNDEEFFSTSYLSYGADQFRERLWDLWVTEAEHSSPKSYHGEHNLPVIFNPCSFVGYQMSYKHYTLLGTGNALLCAEQINRLIPHHDNVIDLEELEHDNLESSITEQDLHQKRKMVGGVEHPPLRGKFYGMSLYFFTLDCLRELSDPAHPIHVSWPTPSIEELTHALDAFCARKWQDDLEEVQHEAHEHTRAEVLPHRCVEAVYMVTLLRDGFGFHPSSRDITFTHRVEGNEVEWSLGMALSEFAAEKGQQMKSNRDDDDIILRH